MTLSFAQKLDCDFRGYRRSAAGDPYDDNLLDVRITVRVEGFMAEVEGVLLALELDAFLNGLRRLYGQLDGTVDFRSQRNHLRLRLAGDGLGHIACSGEVSSDAASNRAQFAFEFDQTDLRASMTQLEKIISTFPVRAA